MIKPSHVIEVLGLTVLPPPPPLFFSFLLSAFGWKVIWIFGLIFRNLISVSYLNFVLTIVGTRSSDFGGYWNQCTAKLCSGLSCVITFGFKVTISILVTIPLRTFKGTIIYLCLFVTFIHSIVRDSVLNFALPWTLPVFFVACETKGGPCVYESILMRSLLPEGGKAWWYIVLLRGIRPLSR